MGREDVTAGRIKQVKGKVNEVAGAVMGNSRQEAKGKLQKAVGKAQVQFGKATTGKQAARLLALAAILGIGLASVACETSHTETDKQGILGGNTHEETTTTHNPVSGTDDVTHTETKTP